MQLNRGLSVLQNRRTSSIKFSVSYEKDTTKDSRTRQLIKPWPTRTKPLTNQNCYLKPGIELPWNLVAGATPNPWPQFGLKLQQSVMLAKKGETIAWCAFWKLEQLWKSPHIPIATKVKLFNTTCVTILLYGCELWVISQDMEDKINAFATSCYRVMLNVKRTDHVQNATVYSMTNTVPLIHLVRHRQLKFLGHILRMSKEEPARRYALYVLTIGKKRDLIDHVLHTLPMYKDCLGTMKEQCKEQQIAALADDRRAWRNLVVACSAADGWWWWWCNVGAKIPGSISNH